MTAFVPLRSLIPADLVPVAWRDQPLLKCIGRPFIPSDGEAGLDSDLLAHGCGNCLFCRSRRAAFKTTRLLIEAGSRLDHSFLTLTYAPEYEPMSRFLQQSHVVAFIKRLRFQVEYNCGSRFPLRFDYVGEYGGRFGRPHYHLLVFGVIPESVFGRKSFAQLVEECWDMGFVDVKLAHSKSFSYLAKYQAKGLTRITDPELRGRPPQFSGGSRRPGIGVPGLKLIAEQVLRHSQLRDPAWSQGIVPHRIRHEGREKFFGAGAMRLLRMMVGVPEGVDDNRKFLDRFKTREMYRGALKDFFDSGDALKSGVDLSNRMTALLTAYVAPYKVQRETRERIFNRSGSGYDPF